MFDKLNKLYNCSEKLGENTESITCIYVDNKNNLSLYVHFWHTNNITDDLYIKVFNNCNIELATQCCRLKIFKTKYKQKPDDDFLDNYELTYSDKKRITHILENENIFGQNVWNFIIDRYMQCIGKRNNKTRKLLNKYKDKIPNYTKL